MEEKEIEVHGKCYFYTFRALCKGGYLKEVTMLFSHTFYLVVFPPKEYLLYQLYMLIAIRYVVLFLFLSLLSCEGLNYLL